MSDDREEEWDAEDYEAAMRGADDDVPEYSDQESINPYELTAGFESLTLFSDNPNFTMQAFNLSVVDQFIMELETETLSLLNELEKTPIQEAVFLSAQTQLWLFGIYEILRTWRKRGADLIKWADNGGLDYKIAEFKKDVGYKHFGRELRLRELEKVKANPEIIKSLKDDLKRTHMLFSQLETLRVSMAKHELRGKRNSVAYMPGYGRINRWCGSLDYELENGITVVGYINRRNFADMIRSLATDRSIPSQNDIDEFDKFLAGPSELPDFDVDEKLNKTDTKTDTD